MRLDFILCVLNVLFNVTYIMKYKNHMNVRDCKHMAHLPYFVLKHFMPYFFIWSQIFCLSTSSTKKKSEAVISGDCKGQSISLNNCLCKGVSRSNLIAILAVCKYLTGLLIPYVSQYQSIQLWLKKVFNHITISLYILGYIVTPFLFSKK